MCSSLATRLGPAQFAGNSHLRANRDPHDYSIVKSNTDNDDLIKLKFRKPNSNFDFLGGSYRSFDPLPLNFPLTCSEHTRPYGDHRGRSFILDQHSGLRLRFLC
jgi:hypothetical protein